MNILKVSDVINRINDIEKCRRYLEEWMDGKIMDQNQIDAIADDIDTHLEAYAEMLMNKEIK